MPSSSCTGRSAPARPPSCATCCARSASQGRIKSPTYARDGAVRASGHGVCRSAHFDFYRFNDPREWEDAGLSRRLRRARPEAGRMAREGRRRCCRVPDLRMHIDAARRRARARRAHATRCTPRGRELLRMNASRPRAAQALRAWARWRCCWAARELRVRRQHRRGARLAGGRLHARDDRVRRSRSRRKHFLAENPPRLVVDIDGLELSPQLRELVGKVRARRPVHRRRARRPEPAARGAPGGRPEAGDRAAAVHARAGGGLPAPAGLRPLSDRRSATRCWR